MRLATVCTFPRVTEVCVLSNGRGNARSLSKQGIIFLLGLLLVTVTLGIVILVLVFAAPSSHRKNLDSLPEAMEAEATEPPTIPTTEAPTEPPPPVVVAQADDDTMILDGEVQSEMALLIDCEANRIVAVKGDPDARIYPASMTKILTVLTAIEHIDDFSDTFTFTEEIIAPLEEAEASRAGFLPGETVTMNDLLYAAALPSGADGTMGLALATAGSEEAFVAWMNETVEKLHLENTHFTNNSGLHDEDHYSSMNDIAVILRYAIMNERCKQILGTYTYTTSETEQHPEGILLESTMFSRMYGTEVEGIRICGGKTGYTDEAGQCLANWAETPGEHRYVTVTAKGMSKWHNIFDTFRLYGIITGTYDLLTPEESAAPTDEAPAEEAPAEGEAAAQE